MHAMDGKSGPSYDRVQLTAREVREIDHLEQMLAADAVVAAGLSGRLALWSWFLMRCVALRRAAILLLPIGGIGMAAVLTTSIVAAVAFALAWTIGFAALLVEVRVWVRAIALRHRRDAGGPS